MPEENRRHPLAGKPIRRRGGGPKDETFTLRETGMLNITKIWRFHAARPELFDHVEVPIDDYIRRIVTEYRDLDPHRLSAMTAAEVDDPDNVALAVPVRGVFEPIDGNHLIAKRAMLGRDTFRCVLMPERLIPQFLVRWEVQEGRRWRSITTDELLMALDGVYGQADGRILDADGNEVARLPPSAAFATRY